MTYFDIIKAKRDVIMSLTIVILIAVLIFVYSGAKGSVRGIPSSEAGERIIKYVNAEILQGNALAVLKEIRRDEKYPLYKATLTINDQEIITYATLDGALFFPEGLELNLKQKTIGDFNLTGDEVCYQDSKPLVYFFGTSNCPHCQWEQPVVEGVIAQFGDNIIFKNNVQLDIQEADIDIFNSYSQGSVPLLVVGCKYSRVGSGESFGSEQEAHYLGALMCDLTDGVPGEVCDPLEELTNQLDKR